MPRLSVLFVRAGAVAIGLAGAACAVVPAGPPPADPPGRYLALTAPVIALGDTQEHESTGFPLVDNDSAVDDYVEVAQRPPEAPLFSRRILEWVVEHHRHEPVIHLGDVLDMSCRSELKRMAKLARSLNQPAALLPGNHDGLLFGIFNYDFADIAGDADARRWNLGCRTPVRQGIASLEDARGQAVTKRDFIAAYLDLLRAKLHPGHGLPQPPAKGDFRFSWRSDEPDAFVEAIDARLADGRLYSASYLAQRIAWPAAPGATRAVKIVALDTNQLITIVSTLDALRRTSPGDVGRVDGDQVDAIAPWIEEARRRGDIVVFAGHHNWDQLGPGTRFRLAALMERLDHPLVYLSAHTHRGFWARHHLGVRPLLELNVSSLSDWPIAYRRVSIAHDPAANRLKVVAELMPRGERTADSDAELLAAWAGTACEKAGLPLKTLADEELAAVRTQKASRGALWEWLVAKFGQGCDGCDGILFDHAHAYQDQLLTTIEELARDVGEAAADLSGVELPDYCDGLGVSACAARLKGRRFDGLRDSIFEFRRKARLVDRVNEHLDDVRDERAKAYMACRAVLAAKADFDETAPENTPGKAEAVRRAGDFFRTEATVGMR